jgi:hypothetical protein
MIEAEKIFDKHIGLNTESEYLPYFKEEILNAINEALAYPASVIESFAQHDIHIEIRSDAFELKDSKVCYRSIVHFKRRGVWLSIDLGCYPEWSKAFGECVKFAEIIKQEQL